MVASIMANSMTQKSSTGISSNSTADIIEKPDAESFLMFAKDPNGPIDNALVQAETLSTINTPMHVYEMDQTTLIILIVVIVILVCICILICCCCCAGCMLAAQAKEAADKKAMEDMSKMEEEKKMMEEEKKEEPAMME